MPGGCRFRMDKIKLELAKMNGVKKGRITSYRQGVLKRMSSEIMMTESSFLECMTCPRCKNYVQPPSVSCEYGHFICSPCKDELDECPRCGTKEFPNIRNSIFDRILTENYYPCVNQENGCLGSYKLENLAAHQEICAYRRVSCRFEPQGCPIKVKFSDKTYHEDQCPYGISCRIIQKPQDIIKLSCKWRGPRDELKAHVDLHHNHYSWLPSDIETNVEFAWMMPIGMNFETIELLDLKDVTKLFYFYMKNTSEDMQYVAIQYIDRESDEYQYSVEFRHAAKKITLVNKVLRDSVEDVYSDQDCCAIPFSCLKHQFQAERVIDCYIKIFKTGQSHNPRRRITSFMGNALSQDNAQNNRSSLENVIRSLEVFNESTI